MGWYPLRIPGNVSPPVKDKQRHSTEIAIEQIPMRWTISGPSFWLKSIQTGCWILRSISFGGIPLITQSGMLASDGDSCL
jgi:hypothetical protein